MDSHASFHFARNDRIIFYLYFCLCEKIVYPCFFINMYYMLPIFLTLCIVLFFWMTSWYCVALFFRRTDIVDMVWWLSYGIIAFMFFLFFSPSSIALLPLVFVMIWSLRLVYHIILRLMRHGEDSRYAAFRTSWWKYFFVKSYFFIFLLQWFFIAIISLPFLFLFTKNISLSPQFIVGSILWIIWFLCEFFADKQMAEFRRNPKNKWKIIQSWLWKYSRHPNYFWELLMWWSLYLMSIQNIESMIWILSPILLSYLIIYVTWIPLLEEHLKGREWYSEYIRRTSILIPFPPKK